MKLYSKKESMLKQKARLNWLKLGDRNPIFFHKAIQKRRHRNIIKRVFWNGAWLTDSESIKRTFYQFYSAFLRQSGVSLLGLGTFPLPSLDESSKSHIIRPILKQEVEAALYSMDDDKAPGLDGLNIRSLKFLWPLISTKVMIFIERF